MGDLAQRVLAAVQAQPGRKASSIAAQLGADRRSVNAALYGPLRSKVRQDKGYRWYPRGTTGETSVTGGEREQLNTPLARLCRYYLECLSHDDLGGVSEFASSKYGDPNYVELDALPMLNDDGGDPFDSEAGRRLLGQVRRDRNPKAFFLGYPVRLNHIRSRKGWEGLMVEPLLLFSFQEADTKYGTPTLTHDLPQINFRALRALSNAGENNLLEEAIQLGDELGLGNALDDQPDLDELLARLVEIRPEWDWRETANPFDLSRGMALSEISEQGIYNRAVLLAAERSPYTKGLEFELGQLQSIPENRYAGTALGDWLSGRPSDSPLADEQPLLEVLPLNTEQRQAVRQALSNPLTVVTGPPGTGKSQVVTSILVNAAWQGKTVLFASKNNKAVDVVETRVNALGPRPVLLRLGANEHRAKLVEYLISLLAASASTADDEQYREQEAIHDRLRHRSDALDAELHALIELRNDVDHREQQVEQIRKELGAARFQSLHTIDGASLRKAASSLQDAVDRADKPKQPLATRLIWPFVRSARSAELAEAAKHCLRVAERVMPPRPDAPAGVRTIVESVRYGRQLVDRVNRACSAQEYFARLNLLSNARSLEQISRERKALTADLSETSGDLWNTWLRLQSSRVTPNQRKLLGDYSALLQMIASANDEDRSLGRDIFRRYYELLPRVKAIFSCWAVTSLSARGRIPLETNSFDLLVIDEASQCDIASALPLLYRARRVVVIGDPMQLRHISTLSMRQDRQLLSKHELVDDYAGWAYSPRSLFDLASGICRSEDIVALRDHHRSHADIIEFSNESFYEGRLRVATRYDRLRFPGPPAPAVRWVDVRGKTVRPGNGGAFNEEEAGAVVAEIERLVSQGYRGTLGVVTPFRAQANRIRDIVNSRSSLSGRLTDMDFLVHTVHQFQGDERDVMIFSPVVSAGISDGALGFLRSSPYLFNVAVTRARAALVVVGDKTAALNCQVDYLEKFASYATSRLGHPGQGPQAPSPTDIGPEYPSVAHPERVSEWERLFYAELHKDGFRPIPQYSVEKYDLDLALVDGDRRLDIEVDGEHYHRNWNGELCRRDQIRNQRLMELGWDVLRFWVYQIRDDLPGCVERVRDWSEGRELAPGAGLEPTT